MVTIKMVAKKAGVSTSTVSRALSGKIPVDEITRKKVLEAVQELDYYPNALAKGLKEGKTNTIALLVPNIQNRVFPDIAKGVEDVARKNGVTLILCNTDENISVELEYIQKLKKGMVDGFIFATAVPGSDHILKLKQSSFPVVLVSRIMGDEVDAVGVDNFKASFDAVMYLVKTGHRRIAIINGTLDVSVYNRRFEGYKAALEQEGIEYRSELVIQGDNIDNGLYSMVYSMLKKGVNPDAIFAASDPKAIIAMKAIKDIGMKIPDDISVIGFDNMDISSLVDPPLTTISQPLYDMGVLAAKKLIAMIKRDHQEEPVIDILSTDLIIRKSTK